MWNAVAMGTTIGALGVFVQPIQHEFGWTSEQIGRPLTAFVLAMTAILPAVGLLIGKVGARIVMACGAVLVCLGYGLASGSRALPVLVFALATSGVGLGASAYLPCTVVISEWFSGRRGLALGMLLAASAIGATAFPILIAPLVLHLGWRQVMAGIGLLNLVVGLPIIATLAIHGPYRNEDHSAATGVELPLRRLMQLPVFRLVTLVLILSQLSFYGIYFHLIPFLTSRGFPETTAVLFYSGSSLATFVGSMILGPLIDRCGAKPVLVAALSVLVLSSLLLPFIHPGVAGVTAGIVFALFWGSVVNSPLQFAPILLADAVGVARFGTLLGISNFLTGLISSSGPLLTGAIHDATHGYVEAFLLSTCIAALALVPALLLLRQRPPE
ncbi:MAG: hypothetical protein CMLOHMNK_02329 [Steroidobacteraceae bacterium]|nr:hypothetical protein [Steroidobacteraceae bacterium]